MCTCRCDRLKAILVFTSGNGRQCPPQAELQQVANCSLVPPDNCKGCIDVNPIFATDGNCGHLSNCGRCKEGMKCLKSDDCVDGLMCSIQLTCVGVCKGLLRM